MNALTTRYIAIFAFGLALLAGAATVSADEPGKLVSFDGLDPAQPADVAVMYERITAPAKMVCRESAAPWDGRQQRNYQACVQGAIDQAVMDTSLTALTDLHQGTSAKLASH